MIRKLVSTCLVVITIASCKQKEEKTTTEPIVLKTLPTLTLEEANRLASLPLECLQVEYPNKLNQTLNDITHLQTPKELHPAFYGCFDWHSSVHGHWSLISLLKQFPNIDEANLIKEKLSVNISKDNILNEIAYFNMKGNSSYERTYGWAWVLKLAEELHTWEDPIARELEANLQPLTNLITENYITFLPKLNYPLRVGEHTNTAFGLSFALDYAITLSDTKLSESIKKAALRFYADDSDCPLSWEPNGFDFLSPCLEEANLMRKIYSPEEFKIWFDAFLPELTDPEYQLEPGKVSDRTDGKLVHLDGLNFSRSWCLYRISESLPEYTHLKNIATDHINTSLPSIVDGNYSGTHWLGSFALYSLNNAH
ncbi:DUF2891 domain-containing protein [Cellulophaga baltica]|uniref:DUF2891 domain-containing protein n=1 Tax=Cellulophaga TaxID=104264 RepID=UPI001C07A9D1|nr:MULTISPECIES: DUF2891 domain-containing protein [Cellulophaga]MBU2997518.1 DUF2891 domain-containing protein [Cellulophaga baltica]MDO6768913.1 DUF2891 domain-containing protein [Cellulophaga sp. 1_MG-2023]